MIFIDYVEIVCGIAVLLYVIYICVSMGLFKND